MVHATSPVLALQLKRFGFGRFGGGKISRAVKFDEELDLAPYCTRECVHSGSGTKFRLYAVLVHQGSSIHGGHYYCYVRAASDVWHMLDDSHVSQVSVSRVLREKAYMLFYQKEGERAPFPQPQQQVQRLSARLQPSQQQQIAAFEAEQAVVVEAELPSDSEVEDASDKEEDGEASEQSEEEQQFHRSMQRGRRASFIASAKAIEAVTAEVIRSSSTTLAASPNILVPPRRASAASRKAVLSADGSSRLKAMVASNGAAAEGGENENALALSETAVAHREGGRSSIAACCFRASSVGTWAWWRQSKSKSKSKRRALAAKAPMKPGKTAAAAAGAFGTHRSKSIAASPSPPPLSAAAAWGGKWCRAEASLVATDDTLTVANHGNGGSGKSSAQGGSRGGTFGVGTWDGLAAAPSKSLAKSRPSGAIRRKGKRAYDCWDAELDKGHVRRTEARRSVEAGRGGGEVRR